MATFKQLQDRVKVRIIDLPTEVVLELPALVNEAIRDAQEEHNFRIMEATQEFTTVEGTHDLGTITSFKEFREDPWLRYADGGNDPLENGYAPSLDEVLKLYSINDTDTDVGKPEMVFQAETNDDNDAVLEVYPFPSGDSDHPDGDWRVNIPYWKYLPALVNNGDSNWFTVNGEKYVLLAATALAFELNEDHARADRYFLRAAAELKDLEKLDKRSRVNRGLVLIPRRDVYATYRQGRM